MFQTRSNKSLETWRSQMRNRKYCNSLSPDTILIRAIISMEISRTEGITMARETQYLIYWNRSYISQRCFRNSLLGRRSIIRCSWIQRSRSSLRRINRIIRTNRSDHLRRFRSNRNPFYTTSKTNVHLESEMHLLRSRIRTKRDTNHVHWRNTQKDWMRI